MHAGSPSALAAVGSPSVLVEALPSGVLTSDLVEGVLPSETAGAFEFLTLKVSLRFTYVLVEAMPNDLRPCRGRATLEDCRCV
jgi:hypothetical protein